MGNFQGGCPPVNQGWKGPVTLTTHAIWGFSDPAHAIWWVVEITLAVKLNIVGVAVAKMQWCHFVYPSCCQKNTAFQLVLQSAWGLLRSGKQVARSSTPCRKRSQVWGT